jgi:hypothetical protein
MNSRFFQGLLRLSRISYSNLSLQAQAQDSHLRSYSIRSQIPARSEAASGIMLHHLLQ